MSSAPASALPLAAAPAVSDAKITARKAALAAAAGTAIEYYEFGVYGYLASTIGPMFFLATTPPHRCSPSWLCSAAHS